MASPHMPNKWTVGYIVNLGEVSLFTVIATIGAALEVTAASLAIETFVPMDERSAARLRELSEKGRGE